MSKLSQRQNAILREFGERVSFTKKEAVDLIGGGYYYNAPKYVGEILSRMVNSGMIPATGLRKPGIKPRKRRRA